MIKNILFDFGNVILNLNESATYTAFSELLDPKKCDDFNQLALFPFERGEISEESFFNRLQRRSKYIPEADVLIKAWNAMLQDLPPKRLELLKELKNNYRLFLLSNTNITHLQFIKRYLKIEFDILDFEKTYFTKVYYSFEIGLRKPDLNYFNYVISDSGITASESIFIDDKIENVEAATQVGFNVHHHNPSNEISDIIFKLLG